MLDLINYGKDYDLILEYNKRPFPEVNQKGEDMYHNLETDFSPEMVGTFNVNTNIIIAGPNKYNYVKRNKFGGLDLLSDKKVDVSNCPLQGDHALLTFMPKIKLLYPKGVKLCFDLPVEVNYCGNVFHNHTISHNFSTSDEVPDYHVYNKFYFVVCVDLKRLKKYKNVLTINEGFPIISLYFTPKYFVGDVEFAQIDNIYYIKNDEFLQNFDKIY